MTKHNKLSQKIQNTAQLYILTTSKRSKIAIRHVSWAQNYQNCDLGSALDPTGGAYSTSPDPLAEFQWKRKGEGTGRTEREGGEMEGLPSFPKK